MFESRKKDQPELGFVSPLDDRDIEVTKVRRESRHGLFSEGLKLARDIFLIIVVFILFGVFFVQPVVVEGTSMMPQLHDGERLLVNKLVYYRLQSVLRDYPELTHVSRLTLGESLRCVRLVLWDEGRQRLISFREMRHSYAGNASTA